MEDEDGEAWFVPNATNADVVALFKQLSIEKRTECTTALQALGRGESANEAKDLVLPRDIETVAGKASHDDRPTFLSLPAEIRNEIYKYILVQESETVTTRSPLALGQDVDTALFQTCKQMYHEAASLFYNTNEFSVNLVLKGNRDAYNIPEATYCCANAPWVEGAMRFQAGTIRLFLSLSFPDEEECSLLSCFFYSIANALHSGYSKYGHHCGIDLIIDWRAAETPMLQFASAQDRAKTIRRWNRARSAVESLLWEFLSIAPEGCINTYTAFVSFVWDKGPAFSHPYERFRPIYLKENLEEGNIVFRSWSGDGEKPPDGIEGVFDELATF